MHNEIINKFAKHPAITTIPHIIEITAPLKEHFDIDFFAYQHDYLDLETLSLQRAVLCNDVNLLIQSYLYLGKNKRTFEFHKNIPEKYFLGDNDWTLEMGKRCNLHNFVQKVSKVTANSMDSFILATHSTDNGTYRNFYMNNRDLLDKFILYFQEKAEKMIATVIKNKIQCGFYQKVIIVENDQQKFSDKNRNHFLQTINPKHQHLRSKNGTIVKIPIGEMKCLKLLAQGHSAKGIGNILNISPRTVETNWQRSKKRLGCYMRKELLDILNYND